MAVKQFKPFTPGSYTWRDFGSYRFQLMLPQAFLMQVMHPVINAGVAEHSSYKTDPWGRATRSIKLLWPIAYGRPDVALEKATQLREMHRAIKGVDKDGKKYFALDPEAYAWVHGTAFDATVRMHELFGHRAGAEEVEAMFQEWRSFGEILGVRESELPKTQSEYWDYFNNMIDARLARGEVAEDLLSDRFYFEQPKPPNTKLPDFAWRWISKPVGFAMKVMTVGTLPARLREKLNIPYSKPQQFTFAILVAFIRLVDALTPQEKRYIPLARKAIADAKRNPQAYVVNVNATIEEPVVEAS